MNFIFKGFSIKYHYLFSNKDRTILFLHGWGGNENSFCFLETYLKNKFNLLAISFPPYFTSQESHQSLTMDDYLKIILYILKLHNISKIDIICHSFGFRLTLMLCSTKIKINSLIVTGGAGINLKKSLYHTLNLNAQIIKNKMKVKKGMPLKETDYTILNKTDKETFKNVISKDTTPYLKIDCDTLLFWGEKDTATPKKIAKYLNKNIKRSRLITVKSDHFAYLNFKNEFLSRCLKFYEELYD